MAVTLDRPDYRVLGKSAPRVDAVDKVTGAARYGTDRGFEMKAKLCWGFGLVACVILASFSPTSIAASRESERIAFTRGGSIWTIGSDGKGAKQLTKPSTDSTPVWSRDGKQLALIRQEPEGWGRGELWVIDADGRNERRLVKETCWSPLWSSVADELVYVRRSEKSEKDGIYLGFMDSAGRRTRKPYLHHVFLPLHGTHTYQICDWSKDGKRLSVANFGYMFVEIEELALGAEVITRKKLFPRAEDRRYPPSYVFHRWNPTLEDNFLLIRRGDRDVTELLVGGPETELRRLVKLDRDPVAFFAARADWSPSGKQIVYESQGKVFTLRRDKPKPDFLTDGYCPSWAPQ